MLRDSPRHPDSEHCRTKKEKKETWRRGEASRWELEGVWQWAWSMSVRAAGELEGGCGCCSDLGYTAVRTTQPAGETAENCSSAAARLGRLRRANYRSKPRGSSRTPCVRSVSPLSVDAQQEPARSGIASQSWLGKLAHGVHTPLPKCVARASRTQMAADIPTPACITIVQSK